MRSSQGQISKDIITICLTRANCPKKQFKLDCFQVGNKFYFRHHPQTFLMTRNIGPVRPSRNPGLRNCPITRIQNLQAAAFSLVTTRQSHEQRRSESASSATGTRVAPVQIIGTLMTWGVSGHCQSGNLSCCSHAGTVRRGPDLEQWHSLSLRVMFEFLTSHGRATRMLSDDS